MTESEKKDREELAEIIRKFVVEFYGEDEEQDPSWNIERLADYILTEISAKLWKKKEE
jgi:hypothetical protein